MDTPPLLYKSVHVTFVFWVPKTPPTPYMSGTFVLAPPPPAERRNFYTMIQISLSYGLYPPPSGSYSLVSEDTCTPCPAGYLCQHTAAPAACSTGYYSLTGNMLCVECSAGYYCPTAKSVNVEFLEYSTFLITYIAFINYC